MITKLVKKMIPSNGELLDISDDALDKLNSSICAARTVMFQMEDHMDDDGYLYNLPQSAYCTANLGHGWSSIPYSRVNPMLDDVNGFALIGKAGGSKPFHRHMVHQHMLVLDGKLRVSVDDENNPIELTFKDGIYKIEAGTWHSLFATTDVVVSVWFQPPMGDADAK